MPHVTVYRRSNIGVVANGKLRNSLNEIIAEAISAADADHPVKPEAVFITFVTIPYGTVESDKLFNKDMLVKFELHGYPARKKNGDAICSDISGALREIVEKKDPQVLTIVSFVDMAYG